MNELIQRWMYADYGNLRTDRCVTVVAFVNPTEAGGYVRIIRYGVQLRERRELCALCQAPFVRSGICQNNHAPDDAYEVQFSTAAITLDLACAELLTRLS